MDLLRLMRVISIQQTFLSTNMILIKGSVAVGTENGMKMLTEWQEGGYPILSFESPKHLVEWIERREKEVDKEKKDA